MARPKKHVDLVEVLRFRLAGETGPGDQRPTAVCLVNSY